ncbi:hypothetical protein Tco_0784301 [Tanacetum coccineum]
MSRKRRYNSKHFYVDDNEKQDDELKLYLSIVQDEEKEVDYEILDRKYPIIDWKTVCLGTKPQFDESKEEEINLNVVLFNPDEQDEFGGSTKHEWKLMEMRRDLSVGERTTPTNGYQFTHLQKAEELASPTSNRLGKDSPKSVYMVFNNLTKNCRVNQLTLLLGESWQSRDQTVLGKENQSVDS